jgi:hypothetical protein
MSSNVSDINMTFKESLQIHAKKPLIILDGKINNMLDTYHEGPKTMYEYYKFDSRQILSVEELMSLLKIMYAKDILDYFDILEPECNKFHNLFDYLWHNKKIKYSEYDYIMKILQIINYIPKPVNNKYKPFNNGCPFCNN